ncbi:SCO1860 family LAETG-anchored protein [Streptomyces sp. NPDC093546]|uniref:SCO1860 family LAETG-anchored protein n=1 Tax=Streptomyces sp. NPDC093546 TaxID=3366040 RepID=UPI0037F58A32
MNTIRTASRRLHLPAATALVALGTLTAGPAHATPGTGSAEGRANAAVLRTALDVSLLDKTVNVPLTATLNAVQAPAGAAPAGAAPAGAPASAEKTALTVTLDGVDRGRPFTLLRADTATAKATADSRRAEASTRLARVRLHVPGLPLLSLVEADQVTARAVCEAGKRPVAEANLLGKVTVLGKRVTLTPGGPTRVQAPGIGEVTLHLSKSDTTTRTAAATALSLKVTVNPLSLNVADVNGTLTLAEASCTAPKPPAKPAAGVQPQTAATKPAATAPAQPDLAATGAGPTTPYIAAGALTLLAAGTTALLTLRRRRRA